MTIYAAFLLGYLMLLVCVSFFFGRRVHSQEDFSVAGRSLPTVVVFLTMLATWIGTGSLFGNAEETYKVGLVTLVIPFGEIIGIGLLIMLAGRARRLEQITIQDILETRYNSWARVFGSITLIITAVIIVSYQYRAAEAVIHYAVPGMSGEMTRFLAVTFIILFTAIAGMFSVAYVDVVMGVTMFIGLSLALPVVWHKAGGIAGAVHVLPPGHNRLWGSISLFQALNLALPPMLLVLGDANMYQRFFSARSAGVARTATAFTLIGVVIIETLIILTSWFGAALVWKNPALANAGHLIPFIAVHYLPEWLGGIILMAALAVVFSTAIGYLLVPATSFIRDIYQRFFDPGVKPGKIVWLSRMTVVVLGLIAYELSRLSDQFLSVAFLAYTIYGTSITPVLVAALTWKRATTQGAIACLAGGTAATLFWRFYPAAVSASGETLHLGDITGMDAVIPITLLSTLLLIVVSLLTPEPSAAQVEPFHGKIDVDEIPAPATE